jgi:predicted MFS family arabinose efflux permease
VASLIGLLTLGLMDNQILAPLLPEIASSFGVGAARVGLTVSVYALAAALAALIVGPLSDRAARRPFLIAAGMSFGLASLAVFFTGSFVLFAAARFLAGASAGVISALVVASIADRVPYERRGRAMSWVASAYVVAPILGVPVASWLAEEFEWRALYLIFATAAVLLSLALTVWFVEISTADTSERSHWVSEASRKYSGFLKNKVTAAGAFSAFFVSGGITGFTIYLFAYLSSEFGFSLTTRGMVFLVSGGAALLGAFGAGPISDRIGKRTVAIWGSVALAILVLFVPSLGGGVLLYVGLGLVGLAAASRMAPLQSLVTELVSREARGAYVALRNTFSQLGIAVSAAVGGPLFSSRGFGAVCILAATFSLMAALLLLLVEEPKA